MSKLPPGGLVMATAIAMFAALSWTTTGVTSDDDQDAALERLLEKVEDPKPMADEPRPATSEPTVHDKDKPNTEPKQADDVSEPDDKALDSLLEKIGQEDDAPPPPQSSKPSAGEPKSDEPQEATKLEGKEKDLDRHLKEGIQGKREKKPRQQQPSQGSGKLGEAVDKMREVEKRLSKTDTGESTRKKQGEIIQDLESILKQLRQASSKGSGQGKVSRKIQQAGNQKGGQPGEPQQGANAGGVGPMKPKPPAGIAGIAGDKSAWGHLPPELRTELDNIFKEEPLESRRSLIERYYLSVNKKSQARQE